MVLILHTSTGFIGRKKGQVGGGYNSNYSGNTLYAYRVPEEFTALRLIPPAAVPILECPEFWFLWHYSRYPGRGHLMNEGIK
jgi:hypothetical protein